MASIFSKIIAGDIPSYKIAEDNSYFAFLDINPLAPGHTLVVPKNEIDYLFDLEDQEYSGLMEFSKRVAVAIESVVDCKRIGMTVIGLEVPHAHVHLIPINSMYDMNFEKQRVKMAGEEMLDLANKIAAAF